MQLLYQYNNAVGEKEGSFLGLAKKLEVFGLSYRSSRVCISRAFVSKLAV
jgi:hypothetical protein